MTPAANPITPAGFAALRARYDHLLGGERPKIVEVVSWAAGNGDRSENGDYIYGRKRLREIDRELTHLARRMKAARVLDPARQEDRSRVFFGATVELADEDDARLTITLVGDDEQDASAGRIGWSSPIARAVRGAAVGDLRRVRLPGGEKEWEIIAISYPVARDSLGMFESWGAFRDPAVPRCYAIAMAEKPRGAKVDFQAYADVGHWPKRALRNQIHFRLSRRLAPNSPIRLKVDSQDFLLTGGGGDAWAIDRRMDAAIVAAMRSGKAMRVRARAADGSEFSDFYDLPGAASAIDAAALGCASQR